MTVFSIVDFCLQDVAGHGNDWCPYCVYNVLHFIEKLSRRYLDIKHFTITCCLLAYSFKQFDDVEKEVFCHLANHAWSSLSIGLSGIFT